MKISKAILGLVLLVIVGSSAYGQSLETILQQSVPELYGDLKITPDKQYNKKDVYAYRALYFKLEHAIDDIRQVEMGIATADNMQVLDYKSLKEVAKNEKLDSLKMLIRQKQKQINDFLKWHERLAADTSSIGIYFSSFRDYLKSNNYDSAYKYWKILFNNYPLIHSSIYYGGQKLVKYKMNKAKTPEEKEAYFDTLMIVYEQQIRAYPKSKYFIKALEVYDYNNFYIKGKDLTDTNVAKVVLPHVEECYNMGKNTATSAGDKTPGFILPITMVNALYLQQVDSISADEAIEDYIQFDNILSNQIDKAKDQKKKDKIQKYQSLLNNIFTQSNLSTCDNLCKVFGEKYQKDTTNIEAIKKMIIVLGKKGCTDSLLYSEMVKTVYRAEPTAASAHGLALLYASKDDFEQALKYMDQAIQLQTVDTTKANYYYEAATMYNKISNYSKAREYARKALSINPNMGKAYLLIATMYAATANSVGEDEFAHRAVYWAAVDKLYQAKKVDPSIASAADDLISSYSARFPKKDEGFMHSVIQGDSYTVGGWIQEVTTARYNK